MGKQELFDRYLDIYYCGSNGNRLLRSWTRIHPVRTMDARLKPLQPVSTQEFTDVFVPPFDACVPPIFRAHFCAAIKIELLAPILLRCWKQKDVAICYFLPAETQIFHTGYDTFAFAYMSFVSRLCA